MNSIIVEDILVEDIPKQDSPPVNRNTIALSTEPVEHLAIASRFNIDTPTKEEGEKLSTIWGYVKSKGDATSMSDLIWQVINLEQTVGAPKLGETRLDKLYRYVQLRIQESRIQEELKDVSLGANLG